MTGNQAGTHLQGRYYLNLCRPVDVPSNDKRRSCCLPGTPPPLQTTINPSCSKMGAAEVLALQCPHREVSEMATAQLEVFSQERIDASAAIISDNVADIHKEYDLFRDKCPVAFTTQYGGYHLLTRYDDVKAAALDSATFISSVKAVIPSDPRGLRRPPLNFDAPNHTPYRTALDRTLKPARIKRLKERLEQHAETLLQPLLEKGGGNICTDFGANYAAWVETEWLNLAPETAPKLASTASAWVNAWRRMDREATTQFSTELYDIARDVLADRRRNPRDPEEDPGSSLLLEKNSKGEPLEEVHLV
jgi:cytochrome P450